MSSFGEEIKRERELRKISLREISDATKINIRFLEALENNDFEHLPGGQFNKGFIRAYANYLGIDPEKIVNSYLLEISKQEEAKKPSSPIIPSTEKKKPNKSMLPIIIAAIFIAIVVIIIIILVPWSSNKGARKVEKKMEDVMKEPMEEKLEETKKKPEEENREEGISVKMGKVSPQSREDIMEAPEQSMQEIQTISLNVEVQKQAWIHARCDGDELLNTTLFPGDRRTLMCDKELIISLSDVEAFHIFSKDIRLQFPREEGKRISNFKITTKNLEKLLYGNQ